MKLLLETSSSFENNRISETVTTVLVNKGCLLVLPRIADYAWVILLGLRPTKGSDIYICMYPRNYPVSKSLTGYLPLID